MATPLRSSLPDGAASLESILCTEELRRRLSRPPDYEKETRALVALSSALADSPHTILQTLAETILEVTQSDSSGLSLLTKDDGGRRFYWPAIAGRWKPHTGEGPRAISVPAGTCLTVIVPCCSNTSSGVTLICCPSSLLQKNASWFHFTSTAKQSGRYGRSCMTIVAGSTQRMSGL